MATCDTERRLQMFSIDRAFHNEAVGSTHLAEFRQVEGVVADDRLTLADLIGMVFASNRSRWVLQPLQHYRFYANLLPNDRNRKLAL